MEKRRVFAVLAICFLLLATNLTMSHVAVGKEEEERAARRLSEEFPSLLKPISRVLSGSVWTKVEGILPTGATRSEEVVKEKGDARAQAVGGGAVLVPYRSPSPKFSRNILISRDFSHYPYQTEPSIAVDPNNPDHIVVGMIDFNFPCVTSYVSIDGGATWDGPFQARYLEQDLGSGGDPTVAFDRQSNVYFSYISIGTEEFTIGSIPFYEYVSSIVVSKSDDGGYTWSRPISTARSTIVVKRDEITLGFLDKPWMTLGPSPESLGQDVIYVTYTHFKTHWQIIYIFEGQYFYLGNPVLETTIELVQSTDGGLTWSTPIAVSPTVKRLYGGQVEATTYGYTQRVVQGSNIGVAADGTVYVSWLDTTDDDSFKGLASISVVKSSDGGRTFSKPKTVATFLEPGFSPRTAFFRSWGAAFPQIAVGLGGDVNIVFTARPPDRPTDDGDIYFTRSLDQGESWSRSKRLNDDEKAHFQFFPAIAVGSDSVIHVIWGDFRDDLAETSFHIYYAKSEDGGKTWIENTRVTDFPSNPNYGFPNGAFIGDYFSIAVTKKDVYMVWADTRLGEYGPINQKIGFGRHSLMPMPSIFLSPSAGPGGQEAVIQGFNLQPDQDVFIEVGGVYLAAARTNEQGRFTARIFIPISGQGAHEVRVYDASGNTAVTSFYMDFGFGDIENSLERLKELENVTQRLNLIEKRLSEAVGTSSPEPTSNLLLVIFGLMVVSALVSSGLTLFVYSRIRRRAREPREGKPYRRGEVSRKPTS